MHYLGHPGEKGKFGAREVPRLDIDNAIHMSVIAVFEDGARFDRREVEYQFSALEPSGLLNELFEDLVRCHRDDRAVWLDGARLHAAHARELLRGNMYFAVTLPAVIQDLQPPVVVELVHDVAGGRLELLSIACAAKDDSARIRVLRDRLQVALLLGDFRPVGSLLLVGRQRRYAGGRDQDEDRAGHTDTLQTTRRATLHGDSL